MSQHSPWGTGLRDPGLHNSCGAVLAVTTSREWHLKRLLLHTRNLEVLVGTVSHVSLVNGGTVLLDPLEEGARLCDESRPVS